MSNIKEIWLYHHSHLDVGYTHTQPALWELQVSYLNQAIDLCEQTAHLPEEKRFYWTCEATAPVLKWLDSARATDVDRFAKFLKNGQICICALPMHSSPLCTAEQLAQMLYPIRELRKQFGIPIRTAINHDINGQSWMIGQVMVDAGIELYSTGINIHFGGIPLQRPRVFNWQTADGRKLMTFHGEHYSMFTQICRLWEMDTKQMKVGIDQYIKRITDEGYPYDFIYLSSTNIPDLDNTPPDPNLLTMVNKWNDEGHEQRIRLVTPEILLDKLRTLPSESIKTHRGDWTDYWNFGAASSAYETRLNRRTKISLQTAEFLFAQPDVQPMSSRDEQVLDQVWEQAMIYDEHTWGANISILDPDSWFVKSQWAHKSHSAYLANSLAGYAMYQALEKLASNPLQSEQPQGVLLVNATPVQQNIHLRVPEHYEYLGRQTSAGRFHDHTTNVDTNWQLPVRGKWTLDAFSYKMLPFHQLPAMQNKPSNIQYKDNSFETPFYAVIYDKHAGKIKQITEKSTGWQMLDSSSKYGLMEYVYECIDDSIDKVHRTTLFPRDVEKCNNNISCWNHNWHAKRSQVSGCKEFEIIEHGSGLSIRMVFEAIGVESLEQRFTFFDDRPEIEMIATLVKTNNREPEAVYFVIPLHLQAGWQAVYDTSGAFVKLDEEQLPGVCRDWVTVDQTVSMFDHEHGLTLACPDAPMVQIGGFHFGKEQAEIKRHANPLLLGWPINNYWDTNFQASQSGKMSFKYVIRPYKQFSKAEAYQFGVIASSPVQLFPIIHVTDMIEKQWIKTNANGVFVHYVKRATNNQGVMLRILNVNEYSSDLELEWDRNIKQAWYADILENQVAPIEIISKRFIQVTLLPNQLKTILLATD